MHYTIWFTPSGIYYRGENYEAAPLRWTGSVEEFFRIICRPEFELEPCTIYVQDHDTL